jgi:hypothetical protein
MAGAAVFAAALAVALDGRALAVARSLSLDVVGDDPMPRRGWSAQ